eukprot:TRINITY_DN22599_c0_g2_i2.p1 TRINITY_DN22599_c0_g2~~TRINITY_DN22599_c0_g2_i2.p1  ORF type:complete len:481 (-),score=82.79 TRINITY_DN22599_c0_g2_i2:260-1702(-)
MVDATAASASSSSAPEADYACCPGLLHKPGPGTFHAAQSLSECLALCDGAGWCFLSEYDGRRQSRSCFLAARWGSLDATPTVSLDFSGARQKVCSKTSRVPGAPATCAERARLPSGVTLQLIPAASRCRIGESQCSQAGVQTCSSSALDAEAWSCETRVAQSSPKADASGIFFTMVTVFASVVAAALALLLVRKLYVRWLADWIQASSEQEKTVVVVKPAPSLQRPAAAHDRAESAAKASKGKHSKSGTGRQQETSLAGALPADVEIGLSNEAMTVEEVVEVAEPKLSQVAERVVLDKAAPVQKASAAVEAPRWQPTVGFTPASAENDLTLSKALEPDSPGPSLQPPQIRPTGERKVDWASLLATSPAPRQPDVAIPRPAVGTVGSVAPRGNDAVPLASQRPGRALDALKPPNPLDTFLAATGFPDSRFQQEGRVNPMIPLSRCMDGSAFVVRSQPPQPATVIAAPTRAARVQQAMDEAD